MENNWKERMYDISCSSFVVKYIPLIAIGLGLLCLICMIISLFLFDSVLLIATLSYLTVILPIAVKVFDTIFEAVRSYNKETFLCNKINHLLFANEWIVSLMFVVILSPIFMLIVDSIFNGSNIQRASNILGAMLSIVFGVAISKPISRHFKRKIIYIENENIEIQEIQEI